MIAAYESDRARIELQRERKLTRETLSHVVDSLQELQQQSKAHDANIGRLTDLESNWAQYRAEMETVREDLSAKAHQYEAAAQVKASDSLTKHFGEYMGDHRKLYWKFLFSTLGVILLITSFGIAMSVQLSNATSVGWPDIAWRTAVLTGGAGLATYLGRQAGHHRTMQDWASSIEVQLRTFEAYTNTIAEAEQKDAIRAEFARRVFGPEPTRSKSRGTDEDSGISQSTIIELMLRTLNRSPNEKGSN
ncbi:hypothetical protein BJH93_03990 [Kocuria polaris]|nr:hypothetical protein [Kocuria polaris]